MAEFEQSMSVLAAIKKILTDYPYGNAVLLELLQNADDAEAKHVTALFESFTANEDHPAARSPALVFHNSATFTERDLSNLKSFGTQEETSKRNDASKVGRFGIGFNSSFHVSDVVAFVTGDNLVVFDPAKENLPLSSKGDKIGGMHWRISSLGTDGVYTEDQKNYALRVLEAFEQSGLGFKKEEYYQGTIFRLPLRKAPSTLWKEVHRPVDIANLLVRFFDIVSLGMVMLKHVVKIEACIHRKSPQEPIETLFSVLSAQKENLNLKPWLKNYTESIALVKSETDKINAGNLDSYSYGKEKQVVRQKVMKSLPEPQRIIRDISVTLQKTSLFVPYEKIVTGKHTTDISFQAALDATNAHSEDQEVNTMVKFQIAHQLGPGNGWQKSKVWEISSTNAQNGHAVDVPWGAAIVNMKTTTEKGSRLMCFFPIGGEIQLPINIHGCFKVSSDRQSIKHISDEWNNALATEVIPHAYVQVLAAVKEKKGADYYQLFPTLDYTDGMSLHIAGEFVKLLRDPNLSPPLIAQQNGQWGKLQNVRFPFLRDPYHKPSETHAVAIHCLLVASAEAKRGQLPLATFPHFSLTKPPSAAQINQLDAVAKLFSANTLAPLEVCQFMREVPIEAAQLFLSNAAGIATDVFWMCTKGANTNVAKYYLQLPVIPLAHCPPHNMAFVDSVPKQLLTAGSNYFISSPLTDDTSINVNQCIVCRTPESLALAMEAFPQKIVKTTEDSAEGDCGLQLTHLLDQKYHKLLGIREISVKDLCNRLQLAISHGPLIWRKKSSDPDHDSTTWKLENDETKLSISLANINSYLKQVQKADQGSLSQLATIPFLPVRTRGSTAAAAANDSNGNEQRLSTSLLHTHQKDIKCFRVVSEEKDAKLAEHLSNQEIGIEIDFSIIDSSVVSSMGRFAKLDGSGTLSLIKTNLRNPIHAEFAQSLVAHLSAWTTKIKESNDAQETLKTLPIFKTVGDRLCRATDVVLRPPQLPEILGEVCSSVPGAAKKIQSLFANQQILSVVGYELAREESSAILETIFNTKRMNLSDFWAAAAVLSAEVSSQAEVGTVGHLIFQELIKSLLQANINLSSIGEKLQADRKSVV